MRYVGNSLRPGSEPQDLKKPGASLWRNRDFIKLWSAQTVSNFGSEISGTAIALLAVIVLNARPSEMGVLSALSALPALLAGLPFGVWVDRFRRRRLMIASDLLRVAVLLSIPVASFMGVLSMILAYLIAFLMGGLTILFDIAREAFLPTFVERERLLDANSKIALGSSLSESAGSAAAGGLVQWLSAPTAIFTDVVNYLLSAVFLAVLRRPEDRPARLSRSPLITEIREGIAALAGHPVLVALAAGKGLFSFFGGFIGTLYSLYVVGELGLSPLLLGFLIASGGVGALLGSLLASRIADRLGIGRLIGGSLVFDGIAGLLLPLSSLLPRLAFPLLMINQVMGDFAIALFLIGEVSVRQKITRHAMMGRINATVRFIGSAALPLGFLLGGILGEIIGIRMTFVLAVAGIAGTGTYLLDSPVRT
jgi:MFS family permease